MNKILKKRIILIVSNIVSVMELSKTIIHERMTVIIYFMPDLKLSVFSIITNNYKIK